jgi:hypothetical protein
MNNNIKEFFNKALKYYDNQQLEYYTYINNSDYNIIETNNTITILPINNIKSIITYTYEILGILDNQTHVWIWSWLVPDFDENIVKLTKELLFYGLKLEPRSNTDIHSYLKIQFLNSRILIENDIELDTHLSIISYLMKDKILFILPIILNKKNKNNQTIYYLIK